MRPDPQTWPSIGNVVGRVRAEQVNDLVIQKRRIGGSLAGITAKELVPPEQPQITWPRDSGRFMLIRRDRVFDRGVRAIGRALPRYVMPRGPKDRDRKFKLIHYQLAAYSEAGPRLKVTTPLSCRICGQWGCPQSSASAVSIRAP